MSLKKCPDCGRDVSRSAATCPNCGKRLKGSALGGLLFLVAAFVVFTVLKKAVETKPLPDAASDPYNSADH